MPDKMSSDIPNAAGMLNPAVLRFRGLDQEAMIALQMRNIEAVRRMAKLMLDSAETITECQTAFFKTRVDEINAGLEREEDASDLNALVERQTKVCCNALDALAEHAGELTEIGSKCCANLIQEAAGTMVDLPAVEAGPKEKTKVAGRDAKTRAGKN